MALAIQAIMLLLVYLMIGGIISWVVLDPNLTWDQRVIGGGIAVVMFAILLGVIVKTRRPDTGSP